MHDLKDRLNVINDVDKENPQSVNSLLNGWKLNHCMYSHSYTIFTNLHTVIKFKNRLRLSTQCLNSTQAKDLFQIGLSSKAMRSIHQFFKLIIRFQLRPVPFHKLRLSNDIMWTGKLRDSLWNRLYEDRRHKKNRIERNNVRLCIEDLKRK